MHDGRDQALKETLNEGALGGGGGGGGGVYGPFQQQLLIHFGAGQNQVSGQFNVPPAVQLMIETVTADMGVHAGEQAYAFVETVLAGASADHTISLTPVPAIPQTTTAGFVATHRVQLYADPGTVVKVTLTRWSTGTGYPDIAKPQLVTLSGRTIP